MKEYLLGIDVGTSSCKAAVFTADGWTVVQSSADYKVYYGRPGWAEQSPDELWSGVCSAVKKLFDGGISPQDIAGIGVDGQSWAAILTDKDGNALAPTPIWTDTRAQEECADIRRAIPEDILFDICKNPVQPSYTLPKVLWYKKHFPDIYGKAAQVLQCNSFIVQRLTGEYTQDLSQGYGYCFFDMEKGEYDLEAAKELGMRTALLPPLMRPHDIAGYITKEAAALTGLTEGTPVAAGGLDAACSTLGAGVVSQGQTQEQGGQAGGMSICTESCIADKRLITGFHVVPGRWLLQGGTTGGGGALNWLRSVLGGDISFEDMSTLAGKSPVCSGGITFLPYMAGERSPIWDPDACGVFYGMRYGSGRGDIIRAVMEGVAYSLRHNIETAAEAGAEAEVLRSVGGAANSAVWTQIKADITGNIIEVPSSDTAAALGAAILAGCGTGVYKSFDEAAKRTVKVLREYRPDNENREAYNGGYDRYRELYERLKPMMKGA